MRIAVCPGSFDPITNGHLDIFERAAKMVDVLIVAVFHNPNKAPAFSIDERLEMLNLSTKHIHNVKVDYFSGLLNEYVKQQNSNIIIRGLRDLSDFENEFQRALMIKQIDPAIETIFMMTNREYSFVSSSVIKELAAFNGNISGLIPSCIEEKVKKKLYHINPHLKA